MTNPKIFINSKIFDEGGTLERFSIIEDFFWKSAIPLTENPLILSTSEIPAHAENLTFTELRRQKTYFKWPR